MLPMTEGTWAHPTVTETRGNEGTAVTLTADLKEKWGKENQNASESPATKSAFT